MYVIARWSTSIPHKLWENGDLSVVITRVHLQCREQMGLGPLGSE